MSLLSAFILYNKSDIEKNKWFIEHMTNLFYDLNCTLILHTTDELYSALYGQDQLASISDSFNYLSLGFKPDFVINRSRDSYLASLLENDSIKVFNSSFVTKIANDKDLTYKHLQQAFINHLPYLVLPFKYIENDSFDDILSTAHSIGFPLVMKPAEGHGGSHVSLITSESQLLEEVKSIKFDHTQSGINYSKILLQKPSKTIGKDLRVYVLGGKIICSIMRSSEKDFRANFSTGGQASYHELNNDEKTLVTQIINAFPADFYGIDLIYNENQPIVNEIEDAVGTRMVYANTDIDIVKEYVMYIFDKTKKP